MKIIVSIIGISFVSIAAIALVVCHRYKEETFRNPFVFGGELRSPLQNLFAHLNEEHYLVVNGSTFRSVRGDEPFYLEIPPLDGILFVTGLVDQKATIHLYFHRSKREEIFCGGPEDFGWGIGGKKKAGDPWAEYLQFADSHKIILIHRYSQLQYELTLDLNSGTLKSSQ